MKVLIIEDEQGLQDVIRQSLEKENFVVESASTFASALDKISIYDYDCILLDITLPDGNGLEILEELKRQNKAGNLIIISAKNSIDDKVKGLDLGADDYLPKPFHMAELTARVRSLVRRKTFNGKNRIEAGNLTLDFDNRQLYVEQNLVPLNRKEFDILTYFVLNKNRLVNRNSLAEHIWGDNTDEADNFDFIYSQIKNLRKKLKENNSSAEIQSVYGIGYKLLIS